uniref:PIN domain-containing protein n=1 Tax=Thermofilum pendens TaxID=2269 RepID=A0A7C3WQ65_THEPE
MRIIDADVLAYAPLENHIATPYTRPLIEKGLRGELRLFVRAHEIPIIVSNDKHLKKLCAKYGLIYENPIPEQSR